MLALRLVFGVLSLAIFVGINVYLYRRLVRDVTPRPWVRRAALGFMAFTVLMLPLARLGARGLLPPFWLSFAGVLGLGLALNTFMALVGFDFVRAVYERSRRRASAAAPTLENPERRLLLSRAVAAGALGTGGALTSFGVHQAWAPAAITEVPIHLPGLPKALDGFTIVQLSDIHVGAVIQERFLDQLVETANQAKGDLIAITGDLVDGSPAQLEPFVARLQRLQSRRGVYFCSGNHDYYSNWEAWAPRLTAFGWNVLRNRRVVIGDAGGSFDLLGVEDFGGPWGGGEYDLDLATQGRDPSRAAVLLAHQPKNLEAVADKNIGLQLSGHTHGGQLFPGNLIGQLMWHERNAGLSRTGPTWLYTSRGCGFVGPPMRIGAPPEVVKLVLVAS
jgi:hypothetical protein